MPPRPPHPDEPATTRTRILRAAQHEVMFAGFNEASVDQIARRAGASKQTIYACFESKEQLFRAVLQLTLEEASVSDIPDIAGLGFEEALRVYAAWVERSALQPTNLAIYRANIAAATIFPTLAADLHRLRTSSNQIAALMSAGQRAGRLPPVPADQLANWFGALVMGGVRHLLGVAWPTSEHRAARDEIIHLFSRGWLSPTAPVTTGAERVDDPQPVDPAPASDEGASRIPQARWDDLLKVAFESFTDQGLRQTSVDDISAATGIAKMTIYRRYRNKDSLFAAAVRQTVDGLLAQRTPFAFDGDMEASLISVVLEHDARAQRTEQMKLLRLLVAEAASHPDLAQQAWLRLFAPDRTELTGQLVLWRRQGRLHPICPPLAADMFLTLAAGGNRRLTETVERNEQEALSYARQVVALFLR